MGQATIGAACDLVIESDTIVLAAPGTRWKSCPVAGVTIPGRAITSIGYARGSRPPILDSGGWGAIVALGTVGVGTHLISVGFRAEAGAEGFATFALVTRSVDDLLRALSRIGRTRVVASQKDIDRLPRDLPVSASADALGRRLPDVPEWRVRQKLLTERVIPFEWTPDSTVLLAAGSLWSLPSVQLLARLPREAPPLGTFSADGRTLVLWHRGGQEFFVVDVPQGTTRRRVDATRPVDQFVLNDKGTHALVVHDDSVSAVALDGSGVAWRSTLSREATRSLLAAPAWGAHAWPGGLVAFKHAWVGVWRGDTGEPLFGPGAVLQDLPPDQQPSRIIDAYVVGTPPRLLLLYDSRSGWTIAEADLASGATIRSTPLAQRPGRLWDGYWFSPDRTRLLMRSGALWSLTTFALEDRLVGHTDLAGDGTASFDASGHRVATAVGDAALGQVHVVVWDVATRRPIGQCLLSATSTARLAPDGRTVMVARDKEIVWCESPDGPGR